MKKWLVLFFLGKGMLGFSQGELLPPKPVNATPATTSPNSVATPNATTNTATPAPASSTTPSTSATSTSTSSNTTASSSNLLSSPCVEFQQLNHSIREGLIGKEDAKLVFKYLIPQLRLYFAEKGGVHTPREAWRFPLAGYTYSAIGGKNGSGYTSKGFDYFDGNRSTAHPAHDIFIRDNNQDELDDVTYSHVPVLSMSSGVVVVSRNDWYPGDPSRGGNSVVIYDPTSNALFSYAHNAYTLVSVGDIVYAGQQIGAVGRTGKNAYEKRSPTHLHISYYKISDLTGLPYPENTYQELVNSSRRSY
ncbi:MAG: M23 family metallopeptidase [Bacteroidia bacterium]